MTDETEDAPVDTAADEPIALHLVEPAGLEDHLATLPEPEAAWIRANAFTASLGQHVAMPAPGGGIDRVLVGWGSAAERRRTRFALGSFAAAAPPGTYALATPLPELVAEEAALGWLLARYRFDRYRTGGRRGRVDAAPPSGTVPDTAPDTAPDPGEAGRADLLVPEDIDGARLGIVAEGVFVTRDLINTPAADMGPARLEDAARRLAARHGAAVEAVVGEGLLAGNFPLIHAVGRAAAEAPRLVDLTWGDPAHPAVTLVGKGVTFDTGGLDLKPASAMQLMKKDMGGAATALGLAHMVMGLGLPVRLRVILGIAENAVSAASFRPGDILTARTGRTVEVNNTDAEGRLVLADCLALAAEARPALIADFATLTGAARVAMGPEVVPFFTDDEVLAEELAAASGQAFDPVWRLPLHPGYEHMIEPSGADLDNAPAGGQAGAITAALFLRRFTDDLPWVHFDVYGWTPKARPGRPLGGECQAARAFLAVLEHRYGAGPA
ncbi:MAG: leucyl aminopeptidase family protein [Pseudomonadota bacterium]